MCEFLRVGRKFVILSVGMKGIMMKTPEQLKGSIDEIGNFLKMVADAYQKAMESNK